MIGKANHADRTMILLATDVSDSGRAALSMAQILADAMGDDLRVLHVLDAPEETFSQIFEEPERASRQLEDSASAKLRAFVEATPREAASRRLSFSVRMGHVGETILEEIAVQRPALVVAGTSGHPVNFGPLFGTTASRLARESLVPVLFVPPQYEATLPRRILAPIDFSPCSRLALLQAASLADRLHADMTVLHATGAHPLSLDYEISSNLSPIAEILELERRERIEALVEECGVTPQRIVLRRERPAAAIAAAIDDHGIDLVCMGAHGRTGLRRFFLGSTAERVLRHATRPVMTLHCSDDP